MRHLVTGENIAMIGMRQYEYHVPDYCYVFSTNVITERRVFISNRGAAAIFPLYLCPDHSGFVFSKDRRPNFSDKFLQSLAIKLALPEAGPHKLPMSLTPEEVFGYAYAVLHSPTYRIRYAEFLKIDFPRLPLTSSLDLFRALAKLGGELVALHLMESQKLDKPITKWKGNTPSSEVEKVTYFDTTVWIDKAKTEGFRGVPENVRNFHIGGYQVCEKWLKDRKGRVLSEEDITHYHKIVVALNETIRLMGEIDKVIEKHGGWPGAFLPSKQP
jgi:predicted helicase